MFFRRGTIEKALKPSQRKSITEFATHFGTELSYEEKMRNKKIAQAILITAGVLAPVSYTHLTLPTMAVV